MGAWHEVAHSLLIEGEHLLAPLARLASFDVPHSQCPPKCAAWLVKRFPDAPWNVGLERVDPKGEATMCRAAHLAERLLDPALELMSRTCNFQERALDALRRFSREVALSTSSTELFMDLFCLLFRTHVLAATSPRSLILQVHAHAYAVNRGWFRNEHGGGTVVRIGDESGVFFPAIPSSSPPLSSTPLSSSSEAHQPRRHSAYSRLVAVITAYASPVPRLQRECRDLGAMVCDALDVHVIPTLSSVNDPTIFTGTRTEPLRVPPQRRGRQRRASQLRKGDVAGFTVGQDDDDEGFIVSNACASKPFEALASLEKHLEWVLWGFLCFPELLCRSIARADALKFVLTNALVQPLAGDRWVRVHPLFQHYASPVMHAFGKSLEKTSKERARDIVCLPPGLDARGYKRRLRGLVEDARLAASSGSAAHHHAERRLHVAHECSALAAYLDGEAAAASVPCGDGCGGRGWKSEIKDFGGFRDRCSTSPAVVTMLVPAKLITAILSVAHGELRWLLHHAVAETANNDKQLADAVVAPAVTSLVGGGSNLREAASSLCSWYDAAAAAGTAKVRAKFEAVCRDTDFGVLLRTFPGRTSALVENVGIDGHLAAVISDLTSAPGKREKAFGEDDEFIAGDGFSWSMEDTQRLGRARAAAATKWADDVIANAAESCANDIINRITARDRFASEPAEAPPSKDPATTTVIMKVADSSSNSWRKSLMRSFGTVSSKRSAVSTEVASCAAKASNRSHLRVARRRLAALVATADTLARNSSQHTNISNALRRLYIDGVLENQVGEHAKHCQPFSIIREGVHSCYYGREQVMEILQAAGLNRAANIKSKVSSSSS